jgi:hypothetical protein
MIQSLPSGSQQSVSNHLTTDTARLNVAEHPWLLRARLDDVIELVFEQYAAGAV